MRVKLTGGTNDGRVLNIMHGASVSLDRRSKRDDFDARASIFDVEPDDREIYVRPPAPQIDETGAECWIARGSRPS